MHIHFAPSARTIYKDEAESAAILLYTSFRDLKYELLGKTGHSDPRPDVCPHTCVRGCVREVHRTHITRFAGSRWASRVYTVIYAVSCIYIQDRTALHPRPWRCSFTRPCVFTKSLFVSRGFFIFSLIPPPPPYCIYISCVLLSTKANHFGLVASVNICINTADGAGLRVTWRRYL